ncbi:hypothetical protein D9M69_230070 [compost metagenome]
MTEGAASAGSAQPGGLILRSQHDWTIGNPAGGQDLLDISALGINAVNLVHHRGTT